jgi:hypothetical protein
MIIEYAKDPKWATEDHSVIDLIVKFEGPMGEVPFSATLADPAEHGKELFARALSGEFGAIAAYVPPDPAIMAAFARDARDELLRRSDWTQLPDVPQAIKDLWVPYRQALRDVPSQEGFPNSIVWPTEPTGS